MYKRDHRKNNNIKHTTSLIKITEKTTTFKAHNLSHKDHRKKKTFKAHNLSNKDHRKNNNIKHTTSLIKIIENQQQP